MSDQTEMDRVANCLDWTKKFFNLAAQELSDEYRKTQELLHKNKVTLDDYNPRLGAVATLKVIASKIENKLVKP